MVDTCEPQIFERPGPQRLGEPLPGAGRIDFAARNFFKQILELFV